MGKYKEPMSPQHPPQQQRPVFLNLLRIRQPVTAVLSILHRITGVLMVLLLPGLIYLLDLSLRGPAQFDQVAELFAHGLGSQEGGFVAHDFGLFPFLMAFSELRACLSSMR